MDTPLWARQRIEYDPAFRGWACWLDSELICIARTPGEGDDTLRELRAEIDAELARLACDEPLPAAA